MLLISIFEEVSVLQMAQRRSQYILEGVDSHTTAHPDPLINNPSLITPRKLTNPVRESKNHQDLHRELLLSHKRGTAPEQKPELQRVMEQRELGRLREQKEAQRPKSDLEQELMKRQQKLEQYEKEQVKMKEEKTVPEFVKVKENLRKIPLPGKTKGREIT
ncbi:protein FAM107B-like [Latimeria chalumnae]|uniref:protein FAM107B-like n=1 Tax=Latimeria chalumnae TaxID=7897 RepID=UPI00313BDC27